MVQKKQMYDTCCKSHPLVPQDTEVPMEFQDYVLRSPNIQCWLSVLTTLAETKICNFHL